MAHEGSKYGGYNGMATPKISMLSESRAARRRLNEKKKNKGLDLMFER